MAWGVPTPRKPCTTPFSQRRALLSYVTPWRTTLTPGDSDPFAPADIRFHEDKDVRDAYEEMKLAYESGASPGAGTVL